MQDKPNGQWVLSNQIPLPPLQANNFFNFVLINEDNLKRIALAEEKERKERLAQVYDGFMKNEPDNLIELPTPPKVTSNSIPADKYLTVAQVAVHCDETSMKSKSGLIKRNYPFLTCPKRED